MSRRSFDLQRIRGVANYQFGSEIGKKMFPDEVSIAYSKNTGRIKLIYSNGTLLATLRPKDGTFALTISGARRLISLVDYPKFRIVIQDEVGRFILNGRNVFARHVIIADNEIRPGEEVIVTNSTNEVLAVGKAVLSGKEMIAFNRGVAVKVRRGLEKDK